jgi:hypothetical protein
LLADTDEPCGDGESYRLGSGLAAGALETAVYVETHTSLRDAKQLGDTFVGLTDCDKEKDFPLTSR